MPSTSRYPAETGPLEKAGMSKRPSSRPDGDRPTGSCKSLSIRNLDAQTRRESACPQQKSIGTVTFLVAGRESRGSNQTWKTPLKKRKKGLSP